MANPPQLPFVWELSLDGVVSHAVGAIHVSIHDYQDQCRQLLKDKNALLVEYNFRDKPPNLQKIMSHTLDAYFSSISPLDQTFLAETIMGESLQVVGRRNPLWASMRLFRKAGAHFDQKGIDSVFLDIASEQGIPALSLETRETQEEYLLKMFEKTPSYLQWLITIERTTPGASLDFYRNFVGAYFSGDETKVWEFTAKSPSFDKKIHTQRNQAMAQNSFPMLSKPSLLTVGAAHVVGEHSMLDFYKEQGVAVTRI